MKQDLIELGEKFILQMKLIQDPSRPFRSGNIMCSEEPRCSMFYVSEAEKRVIAMLEEKGTNKVWHVIEGFYRMYDKTILHMETYLLASEEFPELESWNEGFLAHSYTKNLSWGEGEYGDVVIKPHNGGLKRIA
ncbi:MAG: hypothetical protein LBI03_07700 [Clostridiales bacterium]|jgi:hypothetical protein|nr:hypothetical protein [Clostridiales bacterium]